MNDTFVIKRATKNTELFDPLKLHASIVAACRSVRAFEGEAHITAEHVCKHVIDWLINKTEVTSEDIRRVAANHLAVYHPEAAYLYENVGMMV